MDEKEIKEKLDNLLREYFFENWMNEYDWKEFLEEIENESDFSIESMIKDIQKGFENGYSFDTQIEAARKVLARIKDAI